MSYTYIVFFTKTVYIMLYMWPKGVLKWYYQACCQVLYYARKLFDDEA